MRHLRCERGGILVMSAVVLPVFLLICGLVVDAGNWFTHKRQLQNRADAGALAAGYEYLAQLGSCQTNPILAGNAIAAAAKQYAGDPAVSGPKYNTEIAKQSRVTVLINDSDGRNPCTPHAADSISPNPNSLWTDVKVRESNIGTLFKTFGINLPSITARARVQVKQITGLRRGALPFVHETGDYVDCAWAQFIDVRNGNLVSLVGNSNPVELAPDPNVPRRWSAPVGGIDVPSGSTAVGVEYWMGAKTGAGCDFSTPLKRKLPGDANGSPTPIDWINVFDDDTPGSDAPPLLHHFTLTPGSCGGDRVGFVYASSTASPCTIGFTAEVDHGTNPAPSSIRVTSSNGWCTRNCVSSAVATPSGTSGTETTYIGQITYNPTAVTGSTTVSQDYTQVGAQMITARWTMTSGRLTSGRSNGTTCTTTTPCLCRSRRPCRASFETDLPGDVIHATYVSDPLNSSPLSYAELLSGSAPMPNSIASDGGATGPFEVVFRNDGVDQDHLVLLRASMRGTANRTSLVDCGQPSNELSCPTTIGVNERGGSCSPPPPLVDGTWDCVSPLSDTSAFSSAVAARFTAPCTTNNWSAGTSPDDLNPSDPRFAYVALTPFGEMTASGGSFPVEAFARVYVTGGDGMSCPGDDVRPRGYDGSNPQLWGHLVDVVTLSDDALVSDEECNVNVAIVNCRPELVR
jgi:Flp pilus assembly protein TadG